MIQYLKIIAIFAFISPIVAAYADNLKNTINIAVSGLKAQSERIKVSTENIANQDSTSNTPGGIPYTRKVVFVKNAYDPHAKTHLVKILKVTQNRKTPYKQVYSPYHPAANKDGYVLFPNVEKEIEFADAKEASKSYEANLSVIELTKGLQRQTLDLLK